MSYKAHQAFSDLLGLALEYHRAGNLQQAELLYRQILQQNPHQPDALHLLGLLAHQMGRSDLALLYMGKAIAAHISNPVFHNNLGEVYRALHKLPEAQESLQWALHLKPDFAEAHNNLGLVFQIQGKLDDAIVHYQQAIYSKPDYAEAHANLGLILDNQGRLAEAISLLQQALHYKPDYPEVYNRLGNIFHRQGQMDKAIIYYQQALQWRPAYPEVHINLGNLLQTQGKLDDAITHYHQAIHLKPDSAEAYANLGVAFQKQERIEAAIECFQQALCLKPDFVEALVNLGLAFRSQGKSEEAITSYRRALQINPGFALAHNNLGIALQSLGKLDEALASFQQAVSLRPDYAEAYSNMGVVLQTQGKLQEAVTSFQQAIHYKPHYAEAYTNLGVALQAQGKLPEALAQFDQALQIQPQHVEAHWNRSLAWLLSGNFEQGWEEYEWRWKRRGSPPRPFWQPLWDGAAFHGCTLLVHAEQGLGDTLQFLRYLPMVQARGGSVIFECQPRLARLLRQCQGIDQLIEQTSSAPPAVSFDLHIPLLSLPRLFRTTLETIPTPIPYLHAEEELIHQWATQLCNDTQFRIGICWRGNPRHPRDMARSIPLSYFTPLASVKGISLYSLQKGTGREQLTSRAQEYTIQDLGAILDESTGAFVDTAAVMMNLDLVITVDTAIAHLAGALGVPVWVLLPFIPDWRWLLNREDSPWYPTMRLFRQPQPGDWDTVFQRVVETVMTLI